MKILCIHEVRPWMLNIDLSEFDLITFDDGLYSQYIHYKHFLKFNKPLKFFISTGIVSSDEEQSMEFPSCSEAHRKFFENNDTSNYMNWEQILEIEANPYCKIGGHSHEHFKYNHSKIKELYESISTDISKMLSEFSSRNIEIKDFCHPYNIVVPFREGILKRYGINNFYADERIDIEILKGT